jgi:putative sterol carrier protein
VEVKDDVTVKEYFEEYVPKIFAEQLAGSPVSGMEGTEVSLQFDITDGDAQTYSMVVKDASDLEVSAGPASGTLVRVVLSEDVWREAVTGKLEGAVEMFTDAKQLANRRRFDQLKELKGTIELDLSRPDGPNVGFTVTFNGAESPKSIFRVSLENWAKMSKGELPGVTAFMSGQLKIEGDMPFAMALGNLVG